MPCFEERSAERRRLLLPLLGSEGYWLEAGLLWIFALALSITGVLLQVCLLQTASGFPYATGPSRAIYGAAPAGFTPVGDIRL